MRDVEQGKKRYPVHVGPRLLPGLPAGAVRDGFAVFQETGGQGPFTVAGFDGAATQKKPVFPFRDAAHHQFRVLIMNNPACVADMPGAVVVVPGASGDWSEGEIGRRLATHPETKERFATGGTP